MQKGKNSNKKSSGNKFVWITVAILVVLVAIILVLAKVDLSPGKKAKEPQTEEELKASKIKNFEMLADEKLYYIKIEMAKDVSPYRFLVKDVETVESWSKSALKLDSSLVSSWERLGYVNSHIHGDQAFKRYESYTNRDMPDKAAEAEQQAVSYFGAAELFYNKALEFGTNDSAHIYSLIAESYEKHKAFEAASIFYQKALELEPDNRKYEANHIRALLTSGNAEQALYYNDRYMEKYPESDLPYLNYAMYYYNQGDTVRTVKYYEQAVEKGTRPEVGRFLYMYFDQHGDQVKAEYYKEKSMEADSIWDPEKY